MRLEFDKNVPVWEQLLRVADAKAPGRKHQHRKGVKAKQRDKNKPFFLFYAITLPHGRFEIDDQGQYAKEPWTPQQKNYAAMVTRLDSDVGRLLNVLKELKIDDNTIVFFAGDNGSSFNPNSELGKAFDQTMGAAAGPTDRWQDSGAEFEAHFRMASPRFRTVAIVPPTNKATSTAA